MKLVLSFVSGMIIMLIAGAFAFGAGKVALVSYEKYSGDGPSYLYYGSIDPDCRMTTYTTANFVHRSITAYGTYHEGQLAGGSSITEYRDRRPEVMFWDDGDHSMNNKFHDLAPILKKKVSINNTPSIACLGEAKVDKSKW